VAGKFKQWANSVLEPGVLNDKNIQRKRDLAQMLLDQSTRGEPIQHRNQGYKMLMDALNAQIYRQQANRGEKALNEQRAKQMGEMLNLPLQEIQIQDTLPTDTQGQELQGPPTRDERMTYPQQNAAMAAAAQDPYFQPIANALFGHKLDRTAAREDATINYQNQSALADQQNQFDLSKVDTDGQWSVLTKPVPGLGSAGTSVRILEQKDAAGNVFSFGMNEQGQQIYVPGNAYKEAPKTELTGQAAGGSIYNNPKAWETMERLSGEAASDATMYEASSQALNILQNQEVFRGPLANMQESVARFGLLLDSGNSESDAQFFQEFKEKIAATEQLDALGGVMVGSIIKLKTDCCCVAVKHSSRRDAHSYRYIRSLKSRAAILQRKTRWFCRNIYGY
jgi:hypothetical protein